MFHVEHQNEEAQMQYLPGLPPEKAEKLNLYSELIHESNKKFNLTGLKTVEEIRSVLIKESLIPFSAINVPRGTLIADIGTGAGIPGIPLCIMLEDAEFTLFDATLKKTEFIKKIIRVLELNNAEAVCGRIEELGRTVSFREKFNWATTRAMADPYMASELGAPLVKPGGFIYLYTSGRQGNLPLEWINHMSELGLEEIRGNAKQKIMNSECDGILLAKKQSTDMRFPRSIKAIRRGSGIIR
jgi:16S rRNA (guanine527-N7)-methyltransferase